MITDYSKYINQSILFFFVFFSAQLKAQRQLPFHIGPYEKKQYNECLEEQDNEEESIWFAEVSAKLEIVEELLDKFDKKK